MERWWWTLTFVHVLVLRFESDVWRGTMTWGNEDISSNSHTEYGEPTHTHTHTLRMDVKPTQSMEPKLMSNPSITQTITQVSPNQELHTIYKANCNKTCSKLRCLFHYSSSLICSFYLAINFMNQFFTCGFFPKVLADNDFFHSVQSKNRHKFIMFIRNSELWLIMFIISSGFYYEFYHEMSIKCHDQNSGHSKNHNEIFVIQYWNIMSLSSG